MKPNLSVSVVAPCTMVAQGCGPAENNIARGATTEAQSAITEVAPEEGASTYYDTGNLVYFPPCSPAPPGLDS